MKILLLGVGMQGKAALHDLVHSDQVSRIVAADRDFDGLRSYVERRGYGDKVQCEPVDAADRKSVDRLMEQGIDVAIDLMPIVFVDEVVAYAVEYGVHLVNTFYASPEMKRLSDEARSKGISILPEFGMDPGIDLVLLGEAVRSLDQVEEIVSYGAGFPEPAAADNPLGYKVTWTFEGVLKSYRRAGRVVREGETVEIGETEIFGPEQIHEVEIEGLGRLEAFPNGDALRYAALLGLDLSELRRMGRYVLRWPGHGAFWKKLVDLGFLDDEPVLVDGVPVDRKRFLATLLEPRLQYREGERDVVVVRIEATGHRKGKRVRARYQVIDYRDLETGFTAMSRTVGYTASIGAQMIGRGEIGKRGLLSPVSDVPYELFVRELARRNIQVLSEIAALDKGRSRRPPG